ncbi:unnamed protein product [Ophioblennius macclurei]
MRFYSSHLMFAAGLLLGFLCLRFVMDFDISTGGTGKINNMKGWETLTRAHEHTGWSSPFLNTTRVLCWIMTEPTKLQTRTKHIKATWAKHCSQLLYMSSQKTDFPTVGLNVSEGRQNLYWKTIRAFQYIHQNHFNDADWFLKADDDTFVVVENLQYLLSKLDPEKPLYLGRRFKPFVRQGYMSGGAGYVLSKEALRRFIQGFSKGNCTHTSSIEDMALGKCMETMKVEAVDSRDVKGRQTFHAFPPNHHVVKQLKRPQPPFLLYDYYPPIDGPECCSDFAVSFHYMTAVELYVWDYLAYHLRPYGYKYRFNPDGTMEQQNSEHVT